MITPLSPGDLPDCVPVEEREWYCTWLNPLFILASELEPAKKEQLAGRIRDGFIWSGADGAERQLFAIISDDFDEEPTLDPEDKAEGKKQVRAEVNLELTEMIEFIQAHILKIIGHSDDSP